MKMNQFEKYFFSLVSSIIINFIFGCILVLPLFGLSWTLGARFKFSRLDKSDIVGLVVCLFAFLVPWSIYNIYRYHIWKKFKKSKSIYIYTLMIPSFCITFFIIILSIYCYITYDPHAGIFHTS